MQILDPITTIHKLAVSSITPGSFADPVAYLEWFLEKIRHVINDDINLHYSNIAYRIGKGFDVDSSTGKIFDRDAMKLWQREYAPGWEPTV